VIAPFSYTERLDMGLVHCRVCLWCRSACWYSLCIPTDEWQGSVTNVTNRTTTHCENLWAKLDAMHH